jgi:hypothetical protein
VSEGSPWPKKVRQVRSNVKVILTDFSIRRSLFTMNFFHKARQRKGILSLSNEMASWGYQKKRPDAWRSNRWMLHADNSPVHTSVLICKFLAKHETTVVPQPPYSPDLAPVNFFFIPQIKNIVERPMFWVDCLDKVKFASGPAQYPEWSVPEMFRRMKETLGIMYSKWRVLLWRRQGWIASKAGRKFFI